MGKIKSNHTPSPFSVTITLLKGKKIQGPDGRITRPQVGLKLEGNKGLTKKHLTTFDPIWNETFVFPVLNPDDAVLKVSLYDVAILGFKLKTGETAIKLVDFVVEDKRQNLRLQFGDCGEILLTVTASGFGKAAAPTSPRPEHADEHKPEDARRPTSPTRSSTFSSLSSSSSLPSVSSSLSPSSPPPVSSSEGVQNAAAPPSSLHHSAYHPHHAHHSSYDSNSMDLVQYIPPGPLVGANAGAMPLPYGFAHPPQMTHPGYVVSNPYSFPGSPIVTPASPPPPGGFVSNDGSNLYNSGQYGSSSSSGQSNLYNSGQYGSAGSLHHVGSPPSIYGSNVQQLQPNVQVQGRCIPVSKQSDGAFELFPKAKPSANAHSSFSGIVFDDNATFFIQHSEHDNNFSIFDPADPKEQGPIFRVNHFKLPAKALMNAPLNPPDKNSMIESWVLSDREGVILLRAVRIELNDLRQSIPLPCFDVYSLFHSAVEPFCTVIPSLTDDFRAHIEIRFREGGMCIIGEASPEHPLSEFDLTDIVSNKLVCVIARVLQGGLTPFSVRVLSHQDVGLFLILSNLVHFVFFDPTLSAMIKEKHRNSPKFVSL